MKKRGLEVHIHLTNRWLYTFIAIVILLAIGVGVYAVTYTASGAGHSYNEISTCGANQILQMNSAGTAWTCTNLPAQPSLSGAMMGGYIVQYIWGPGTTYGGYDAEGGINVNGKGLGFISSRCGGSYGVASSCTCPAGYRTSFIPGGTGTLQGVFTSTSSCGGKASCVITNFAVFCIKT